MAKQQYVTIDEVWVPVGGPPGSAADIAAHEAALDPHPVYATDAALTSGLADKEDAGAAAAAITAHEAASDPHPGYLTQAEADVLYTAAGGGFPTRATATATTASLSPGAGASTTFTLAPGYRLYQLTTSRPARVRLYTTAAKRDADTARTPGTDPYGNHGVIFDFVTPDATKMDLSPVVDGYDGDSPPDGTIAARITNTDVSAGTVNVQIVWVRMEQ